ncbi:hypothetical protein CYL18_03645 [Pradoshia eiseniae]|uniref:Group-specific protein n=1 Tax=Pradoshia eiseniae TaxID=2064768 RepID=A0A2S7N4R2_9BACI|nr:hypothetical protein [Pradoshia eiseniae]PQD96983.1 hypothetical protein CYL18_03645 [Pradoshia eiseniae]
MFDPTVFENLKVVAEGAFYDFDLDGDIAVIDRHDFIDLAHMSRKFEIIVRYDADKEKDMECTFSLSASLSAFAEEKLPAFSKRNPGCTLKFTFRFIDPEHPLKNIHILKQKWDSGHRYRVFKHVPIGYNRDGSYVTIEIEREKPIYEDDISLLITYVQEIQHILSTGM